MHAQTSLEIDTARIDRDAIDVSSSSADVSANETLVRVLEFALGAVVQCDDKATFVRDILTMRDAAQVDLMAVIERVMAQQSSSAGESDGPDAASMSEPTNATASPVLPSPQTERRSTAATPLSPTPASPLSPHLHLARNAELDRAKRENAFLHDENVRTYWLLSYRLSLSLFCSCHALTHTNASTQSRIRQELHDTTAKLQQRDAGNLALNATIEELVLQRDVDLLRKERSVRALYDDRLHALERDLEAANAALQAHASAASEANELRDEVDLLRPVAERATKAEATAAKYKRKIEELTGVREALRVRTRSCSCLPFCMIRSP